jgi:hypothetical protein
MLEDYAAAPHKEAGEPLLGMCVHAHSDQKNGLRLCNPKLLYTLAYPAVSFEVVSPPTNILCLPRFLVLRVWPRPQ